MSHFIGNIEIPTIQEVRVSTGMDTSKFDLVDRDKILVLKGEDFTQRIEIDYTLAPGLHSGGLTVEEQRDELRKLKSFDPVDNTFSYSFLTGYILVDSIGLNESSDNATIRTGTISGIFLPAPKYFDVLPETGGYGSNIYGDGLYGNG